MHMSLYGESYKSLGPGRFNHIAPNASYLDVYFILILG